MVNNCHPGGVPDNPIASFPRQSRKIREERSVSTVHMCTAPQVCSGELGNYCGTSPCCTTIRYSITGVITSRGRMSYAFGNVGKPKIVLKDKQLIYFTEYFSVLLSASSAYVSQ